MIKRYFHIDTGALTTAINGPAILRETVKRNTTLEREIVFHDGTSVVALDPASVGVFIAKAKNADTGIPEGALAVWDVEWEPSGVQGGGYIFRVPAWGAALEAVTAEDDGRRVLAAAIHVALPTRKQETPTFDLVITPPVWNEDETPEDPDPPYPLPAEIVRLNTDIGLVRISAAGLEIKDTVTDVWRRVSFADGELTFTIL